MRPWPRSSVSAAVRRSPGIGGRCKLHRAMALIGIVKWHSVCKGECLRIPQHRQENHPFLVFAATPGFRPFCEHSAGKKCSKKKNVKRPWMLTSSFTLQEWEDVRDRCGSAPLHDAIYIFCFI